MCGEKCLLVWGKAKTDREADKTNKTDGKQEERSMKRKGRKKKKKRESHLTRPILEKLYCCFFTMYLVYLASATIRF